MKYLLVVFMIFSVPLVSYEFIRMYTLDGHISVFNGLRSVARSMIILGPTYALFTAYFMYIPKESYWEKLENRRLKQMTDYIPEPPKKSLLEEIKSQKS